MSKKITLKEYVLELFKEEKRLYEESLEKTRKILERFKKTGKIKYD